MRKLKLVYQLAIYSSIIVAFVLWFVMFVIAPYNFWLMLSISTTILMVISCLLRWPLVQKNEFNWKNILIGVVSASILYFIFLAGNQLTIIISTLAPSLFTNRVENLNSIYANNGELPKEFVGVLLLFPIGFGEEIYWRGLIQKFFMEKWNGPIGLVLAVLFYVLVHLASGNSILILAAFTCGLFWGLLYWLTGSLVPVLISHMLWDLSIFIIWPIRAT